MRHAALRTVLALFAAALCACSSRSAPASTRSDASTPAIQASASPASTETAPTAGATIDDQRSPAASQTRAVQPATGLVQTIVRGNTSRRVVALTFDAGSDAGYTANILDVLATSGARATFSVTGLWAEQNRDLLLAIAAGGHEIINHTYDHKSFTGISSGAAPLTPGQRALELSRTEVTVYHLAERSTRPYWRPPYGDLDGTAQADAAAAGYTSTVMWTVDTLGWNGATADAIVDRCLAKAESGAIYVMHVGSASQDAVALPRIIGGLRAQGYGFGTVAEIVAP